MSEEEQVNRFSHALWQSRGPGVQAQEPGTLAIAIKLANTYEDYDKGKNQHQHQKDGKKDSKDQEMSRKKTSNFGGGESHHLSKKELAAKMKAGQCFICD